MNTLLPKREHFRVGHSIQWLVGGCIGKIRMYKSIGIPNFYYILMNFLGYHVLFGVYKSWVVHPTRRRRRRRRRTLWGLT
jgi:hypothetical protein